MQIGTGDFSPPPAPEAPRERPQGLRSNLQKRIEKAQPVGEKKGPLPYRQNVAGTVVGGVRQAPLDKTEVAELKKIGDANAAAAEEAQKNSQ